MTTILLVEDEASVRKVVKFILQRQGGYEVLEAPNADSALEKFDENKDVIDLVLTDCVMPGTLSGIDLANRLRKDHPILKVICMSGYSAVSAEGFPFLHKPFLPDVLLAKVQEILDL